MPASGKGPPREGGHQDNKPKPSPVDLRTPQARILGALRPTDETEPLIEWPLLNREFLGVRAGYTAISGTVTRALNGIRESNKTSGVPHAGLVDLGLVEVVTVDVDGIKEINYRATLEGVRAYDAYIARWGALPPVKNAVESTNTTRGFKSGEHKQGGRRER